MFEDAPNLEIYTVAQYAVSNKVLLKIYNFCCNSTIIRITEIF